MLKLLHLTHGKEYQVEVGMITLTMNLFINLVEKDYINRVRKVCVASRDNFQAAIFYLL